MMDLEKILGQAQTELKQCLGEKMTSLFVYGSAAIGDYLPESSDINLLVVVDEVDLSVLDTMRQFMKKMGKFRLRPPLLMTPEHIKTSADVFPIEFLEIKEKHRMLWGEDYFADLEINTKNLRHECEHELKGRLLRIRQSFLEISDTVRELKELLLSAHNANFPAFRTALRLKQVIPPLKREEVTAALAEHFSLDAELFETVKKLRCNEVKLDGPALRALLEKYLTEVEKLASFVDRL